MRINRFSQAVCMALLAVGAATASPTAGSTIKVHVTSAEGKPIEAARVTLLGPPPDAAVLAAVTTDESGNAVLTSEKPDRGRIVTVAEGYLSRVQPAAISPDRPVEVVLEPARPLALKVNDAAQGTPIKVFRVILLSRRFPTTSDYALATALLNPTSITSESGRATVYADPDSISELVVFADGYRPGIIPKVATTQDEVVVELDSSGCRRHFVVDGNTGEPVPGVLAVPAEVERAGLGPRGIAALMLAKSNEEGELTLCPLAGPGEAGEVLVLKHPDYAPRPVRLAASPDEPADQVIAMFHGATVQVVVKTDLGRPVSGARVALDTAGFEREGETNRQGTVTIPDLIPEEETLVSVFAPGGYSPAVTATRRLREGEKEKVVLYLPAEYRLRLLSAGQPLTEGRVVLLDAKEGEEGLLPLAETVPDKEGNLRFPLAAEPGPAALLAVCRDSACLFHRWPRQKQDATPWDVRELDIGDRVLSGKVVSAEDGSAIAGAVLTCSGGGAAGSETTESCGGGGAKQRYLRIDSTKGPLWFEDLDVQLMRDDPGVIGASDRMGRFRLLLHPDCDRLQVKGPDPPPGFAPWGSAEVDGSAFKEPELIVRLERKAAIDVTIVNQAGGAPATNEASLWRWPASSTPDAVVSAQGPKLTVEPPDAGPWWVVVKSPGFAPGVHGPIDATAGRRIPVTVTVETGAYILVDSMSIEAAKTIALADSQGIDWTRWAEYRTAEDGLVAIGPLPLGDYTLANDAETERVRLLHPEQRVKASFSGQ